MIEDGVRSIDNEAFSDCTALTSVRIPASVNTLGYSIFYGCTGLTSAGPIDETDNGGHYAIEFGWTDELPVNAFHGCNSLTSVTLPASVKTVGYNAFRGCIQLKTAGPAGGDYGYQFGWTDTIPKYAFSWCVGLTSVTLPETITSIAELSFNDCAELTTVNIPQSVKRIGARAFENCEKLAGITIPESVTSIGSSAFENCGKLASITIPERVTSIGSRAFHGCSSLKTAGPIGGEYDYQFGWTNAIPQYAFGGCGGLVSVTIPESVTSIGESAFSGCISLTDITIPERIQSIGSFAFLSCDGLKTAGPIGEGEYNYRFGWKDAIPQNAFSGCRGLTSIAFPESVTSIGAGAFSNCTGLTSIAIPEGIDSIGKNAFANCSNLTSLVISQRTASIGENAFTGCSGLKTAGPIGEGGYDYQFGWRDAIPQNAFSGCRGLTSVAIPESVTSIGSRAFSDCTGLTDVTIPENAASIGDEAFDGCTGLTRVSIQGNRLTSIGRSAFYNCGKLSDITLPESVTSIGGFAFYQCESLTGITIPEGVTAIEEWTFVRCYSLAEITLPRSLTSIGSYALYDCGELSDITIPESVASIGDYAFRRCYALTGITIPGSDTSLGSKVFEDCTSNLCVYCCPGSSAEAYAIENHLLYALLRRDDSEASAWLTVNAPSGIMVGETFLVRAGCPGRGADSLKLTLPDGITPSSLWLDGTELAAGAYTLQGNSLTVPVSGSTGVQAHTLHLYCQAQKAGTLSVEGRLVMDGGTERSLGTAAVRVSGGWLSVPEKIGYTQGVLAVGRTAPDSNVTLYVDGKTAEGYSAVSNSAGSWKISFNLPGGASHTVYAEIQLKNGDKATTEPATVVYEACDVNPLCLTMYNTGDRGAQATVFNFQDPDAANLIRYYRIWPGLYPTFTFKAEFTGEVAALGTVSVVTVNGAGVETVVPTAYDKTSRAWVGTQDYTGFDSAPVRAYVIYGDAGLRSNRLGAVPIMDPSGYVYEGVPSNRLEDVKAEIFYQEGDAERSWDAGSYDQLNPQITGPDGSFYWDVPAGSWKVRFTKDGYAAAETAWLPVPPPQVDIGVPMVSNEAPQVRNAAVYEGGAEIVFSQYMDTASVRGAISLNGSAPASVEALAPEVGADGRVYTTRFRAAVGEGLSGTVTLSVSTAAKNYAGIPLTGAYTQAFEVEVRPTAITAPGSVTMKIAEAQNLAVKLAPGVSGRQLTVENLTPAILGVSAEPVTTAEGGGAEIPVTALLPGTGLLRISEPVSGLEREISVQVKSEVKPAVSIEASAANGSLSYQVLNVPEETDAKLLLAAYDGARMRSMEVLENLSGSRPSRRRPPVPMSCSWCKTAPGSPFAPSAP